MIDLHMHILPGADDGARDLEESLQMAEAAVRAGTSAAAATPHGNLPGLRHNGWAEDCRRRLETLRQALAEREIRLRLVEGMEIYADGDVVEGLNTGRLITLNHTRYPLVEFDFEAEEEEIFCRMDSLLAAGYRPVLAHPERYRCVSWDPQCVYEWYRMGVVIQVNKGSLLGRFGRRVRAAANAILRHRLAALVASDAHGPLFRTPDLGEVRRLLDENFGDGCSPLLLEENPRRILEGRDVLWEEPIPFE